MTNNSDDAVPVTLTDMLPVGMIATGGTAAAAMALVAQRKHGQAGWEAFHYERLSATEIEITGGLAVMVGGVKKWQGLHDTVIVTEAEVLQELQQMQAPESVPAALSEHPDTRQQPAASRKTGAPPYLKLVLALPEEAAARQRVLQAFALEANVFGATVQACSLQDEQSLHRD